MVNFGRQGLNLAATAAVTAAVKVSFCLHKLLLRLDTEQCDSTEDLPLLYKKMINSATVLKTWDTIKGLQPSPPHTMFVGWFV